VSGDLAVGSGAQANVANVFGRVAEALQESQRRARQISVHKEAHRLGGERVEGFLVGQLAHEFERGADILSGKIVFALDFREGHAPGEASDHKRDGHAGAANHKSAVANGRVNSDTVVTIHSLNVNTTVDIPSCA
jgi:hypothetical protein